jgi:DNA-binding beta-propeller fold protein YncE
LTSRTTVWLLSGLLALAGTTSSNASADVVYVGDYSSNQIRRFDDTGASISPVPWATGLQTEGLACLMGAPGPFAHLVYAADPGSGRILLLDETKSVNPVVNANFITGLNGVANIALSNDGHILYVAQENAGTISEYNSITGSFIKSINFLGAHDVLVGQDGSVYATAYGSAAIASQGVWKFSANLTGGVQFIARNDNGLNRATGMAFDNAGHFWVANAGTINNGGGTNFVSEYTSAGRVHPKNPERRVEPPAERVRSLQRLGREHLRSLVWVICRLS